ncbi:MAG: dihydrofolate reductase family protein [Thermomicrobiales bacterium]
MANVRAHVSMSLDGYIAGPNDGPELPMGAGGERLHEWVFDLESWRKPHGLEGGKTGLDADVLAETNTNVGAVVLGKRMFQNADGWGETPPFHTPVFVLTHEAREPLEKDGGTTFTFVTDGVDRALAQAKAAAGGKDVSVAGGANVIQQFLRAGLLDELQIHLVPILLGGGVRLFEQLDADQVALERVRVIDSPTVTHLKYRPVQKQT